MAHLEGAQVTAILVMLVLSAATGCDNARDEAGHIERSEKAKRDFREMHPCPSTGKFSGPCDGYVVDHLFPLCAGGCDVPENMQWQEVEAAKAKDVIELHMCGVNVGPARLAKAHCALKTASCATWKARARR